MGCSARAEVYRPSLALPPDDIIFGSCAAGEAVRLSTDMAATTSPSRQSRVAKCKQMGKLLALLATQFSCRESRVSLRSLHIAH